MDLSAVLFQIRHIECMRPHPSGGALLHGVHILGADLADRLSVQQRAIPGLIAFSAFVDKPGIQPLAIRVQAYTSAGGKRMRCRAGWAMSYRLGCEKWDDCPGRHDHVGLGHWVFQLEVRNGGRDHPQNEGHEQAKRGFQRRITGTKPGAQRKCQSGLEQVPREQD